LLTRRSPSSSCSSSPHPRGPAPPHRTAGP
jgi:hypothetical protein